MTNEEVLMKIITDNVNLKIENEGLIETLEQIQSYASIIIAYCDPKKSDAQKAKTLLLDEISTEIIIESAHKNSLEIIELICEHWE